jgi:hypothetical protein
VPHVVAPSRSCFVFDNSNIGLPPAYTDGPSEAARQRGEWAMAALDYSAAYLVLRPYAFPQ